MTTRYVVLHEPPELHERLTAKRSSGGFAAKATTYGKQLSPADLPTARVDAETMSPAEARQVLRSKKAAAIAPVMPMKLIEPVPRRESSVDAAPGAPLWGLRAVGAMDTGFDGEGIVVAVLDTGIDSKHAAFEGVELIRRNFVEGASDDDTHGHGTHCAGTIFGREVQGTRIGVATGVRKALIGKVLGGTGGGSDKIAQAIQWATESGAHVISMSLGIDFPGYVAQLIDEDVPKELAVSMALEGYRANVMLFERLASYIEARGMMTQPTLLVAAAGNESRRGNGSDIEIAVSPPAVSSGFVSVAALGQSSAGLKIASFSNTGARISGPGVGIVSARAGGGLVSMNGTSMATPHVAGVAALWAQQLLERKSLNAQLLTIRVLGSGTSVDIAPGYDPADVGSGLVKAPA